MELLEVLKNLNIFNNFFKGGGLASDDLYLFDMRKGELKAFWNVVPVVGTTPGRRYGHVLSYTKPFLVTFGGNTGTEAVNDFWCLNVEKSPFAWSKLQA